MPNYDYECTVCKYRYELFQMMSEKPKKKCPKCGKNTQRLIGGGSAVLFKGTGFYQTDYKNVQKSDSKPKKDSK